MLALIAGTGRLPEMIVEHCREQQRPLFVLALEGITEDSLLQDVPHARVPVGAVGKAIKAMRDAGVTELIMAGNMRRPKWSSIRPDLTGAKLLARITGLTRSGDDSLLGTIIHFFEEQGFRVVGVQDVLPGILMPAGCLTRQSPSKQQVQDAGLGLRLLRHIGAFDVGQAVILQDGRILAIEGAEGTAGLLQRAPGLLEGKGGVLVKGVKPGQDRRVDLPSMGVDTIRQLQDAGLSGIALEAGSSQLLDRDAIIADADAAGLFVYGMEAES